MVLSQCINWYINSSKFKTQVDFHKPIRPILIHAHKHQHSETVKEQLFVLAALYLGSCKYIMYKVSFFLNSTQ